MNNQLTDDELQQLIWGLKRYALHPRTLAGLQELQERRKVAGFTQNGSTHGLVTVKSDINCVFTSRQGVDHVPPGIQTVPELGFMPKSAELLPSIKSTVVNDGATGKPLTITLPDISSKAFWSGTGKHEVFHPETYKRWVKEAIERDCTIAKIEVKVK